MWPRQLPRMQYATPSIVRGYSRGHITAAAKSHARAARQKNV
jgi:hypothetical protein